MHSDLHASLTQGNKKTKGLRYKKNILNAKVPEMIIDTEKELNIGSYIYIHKLFSSLKGGTVSGTVVGKAVAGGSVSGTNVTASGAQGITTSHSTKLVPMTVASHQHQPQPIKQTIQVICMDHICTTANSD